MRKLLKWIYAFFNALFRKNLTRPQFVMGIAIFTGFSTGMMAVLLKLFLHRIQAFAQSKAAFEFAFLILPIIGILATLLITHVFFKGYMERGISMVIKAITKKNGYIPFKDTYFHILTSSFTVGLGGSAGLEGPIVATGAAVGSNISRLSNLSFQERLLIISCGVASGISAVFNAPVAGVVFAIEILMAESVVGHFVPLIISSVTGVLCSKIILSENILFEFSLRQTFDYRNTVYYIVLGLFCGFVSLYYASVFKKTEHFIQKIQINKYLKGIMGGIFLAFLYLFLPPLFGEGYISINGLASGTFQGVKDYTGWLLSFSNPWKLIIITGLIVLAKPLATGITLGSGGNGGNFAPSLFSGAFAGYFFASCLNIIPGLNLPVGNFSLTAMAGVLSGIMFAPLTGIFLIAEITSGYELFIPLMIVSSLSFFIVKTNRKYAMEKSFLETDPHTQAGEREVAILNSISMEEITVSETAVIPISARFQYFVDVVKNTQANTFAVTREDGRLMGIIELFDVKKQLFDAKKHEHTAINLYMKKPRAVVFVEDALPQVMQKFDQSESWQLPLVDGKHHFVGMVSKTKLLQKLREKMNAPLDIYSEDSP